MLRLRALSPPYPWQAGSLMTYASVSTIRLDIVPSGVGRTRMWPSKRGATIAADGLKKFRGKGTYCVSAALSCRDVMRALLRARTPALPGSSLRKIVQQQTWCDAEGDHGCRHQDDGELGGPWCADGSGVAGKNVNLF